MLEIRDEDRIIGRICRGELRFLAQDIEDLVEGKLNEDEEQDLKNVVEVVNKTIERNQKIRNEMKEKVATVEKSDFFVKKTLSKIDNQIEELEIKRNKYKHGTRLSQSIGLLTWMASIFVPGLVVGCFTTDIWAVLGAALIGSIVGSGVALTNVVKSQDKAEKLDKRIKELELAKLEIIEDGVDVTKTQENEIKINIVKNIYDARECEQFNQNQDDELSV